MARLFSDDGRPCIKLQFTATAVRYESEILIQFIFSDSSTESFNVSGNSSLVSEPLLLGEDLSTFIHSNSESVVLVLPITNFEFHVYRRSLDEFDVVAYQLSAINNKVTFKTSRIYLLIFVEELISEVLAVQKVHRTFG